MTATPFTATVTGSPRIGPKRELKRATESYWKGKTSRAELEKVAATIRRDTWAQLAGAGLDSVPVNTFSYYDQMLDTAVLLGALPERVQAVSDDLDRYFAAARGNGDIAPLEMTKWFDTNYHYIVPEIGPKTTFSLHPEKVLAELKEARELRHSGPSGDHRPDHVPAAEQGRRRRGRTDRTPRRAGAAVHRPAGPAGRQRARSGSRSTSRCW